MVRAQNDLYMVVNNFGAEVNSYDDNQSQAIADGVLTIGELQLCAMNICRFLVDTKAMDRPIVTFEAKEVKAVESIDTDVDIQSLDKPLSINSAKNKEVTFRVDEDGEYGIIIFMRHDNNPVAQSLCKINMNGQNVTNLTLNGTFGRWIKERNINVKLHKGYYTLDLEFMKPGIEMDYIELIKL